MLSTFLFQIVSLILGIYIAVRITHFSDKDKKIEIQKSIAKTAIRQIRSSRQIIDRLSLSLEEHKKRYREKPILIILENIIFSLQNTNLGLADSENSFRDILGEEFKEEFEIAGRTYDQLILLKEKLSELQSVSIKREADYEKKIKELSDQIAKIRSDMISNISSSPISNWTPSSTRLSLDKLDPIRINAKDLTISEYIRNVWQMVDKLRAPTKLEEEKTEKKE